MRPANAVHRKVDGFFFGRINHPRRESGCVLEAARRLFEALKPMANERKIRREYGLNHSERKDDLLTLCLQF